MKKLMIAMSAAAMAVLCAQAEVPEGYISGIDFQKTALGNLNVKAPDVKDGPVLWATTATLAEGGTVESTVVAESEETNANRFLKIDETVPLQRLVNTEPTNVVAGIEISSRVQFTAADEAQEPAPGDKILVWAKQIEDNPTTEVNETAVKLMVTALDENSATKHFDTGLTVETEKWYDLVITALPDDGEDALSPVKFMVKLGDNDAVGPYTSLALAGDTGASTISSIGFQGTGAVDDIGFKTLAAAKDVTVTVSCDADLFIGEKLAEYDGNPINAKAGSKIILWVDADADSVTCDQADSIAWDENQSLTKIIVTAAEGLAVTITTSATPTPTVTPTVNKSSENITVNGVQEKYTVGTQIDPTQITATTTTAHKRAVVTVKVGDTVITDAYTVQKGDVITIDVTEEDITVNVTVTAAEGTTVDGVEAGKVVEGTELSFTVTVADGYKNLVVKNGDTTLEAVDGTYTVTANADVAITTTVDAITYATITVEKDDGVESVTLTVGGETIDPATYKADVADEVVVTVAYTLKSGKVLADDCTVPETVTLTESKTITIATKDEQGGETWPSNWNGGSAATPEQASAFTEWAKTNDATAENAMEAFLMGVDLKDHTPFAAASIAIVNGKVVVTTNAGATPNGVIYVKYGSTVACDAGVAAIDAELSAAAPAQFYKVCIDFAIPAAE